MLTVTVKQTEDRWIIVRAETHEELTRQLGRLGIWEDPDDR